MDNENHMTKILVLNNWSITPPKSGGQHAIFELCKGLAVDFTCTYAHIDMHSDVEQTSRITPSFVTATLPTHGQYGWRARVFAPGFLLKDTITKLSVRAPHSNRLKQRLKRLVSENDVIVCSHPWAWPSIQHLPELKNKIVVYDSHNAETELAKQNNLKGTGKRVNTHLVKRIESSLCQRADLIFCCTENDKKIYHMDFGIPNEKMHVGFKGVKCDPYFLKSPPSPEARKKAAVFIGSNWAPNNAAARYISENLAKEVPDVELRIVGTCCQFALDYNQNVSKLGFVDDLVPLLDDTMIAINPVNEGSGINMKMMEYMAAGLPIVTTPFGARGFTGPARDALVIKELAEFPAAIKDLMQNPTKWASLSTAGREAARNQFDWKIITGRASQLIRSKLSGNTNPAAVLGPKNQQNSSGD